MRVATQVLTEDAGAIAAGAGAGLLMLLWMQGRCWTMVPSVGLPITVTAALNAGYSHSPPWFV